MPATFPAHAAAVLPIKMRWPARFDGVALVVGATGPDQAYAVYGWWHDGPSTVVAATHQWNGLVWFVLPMVVIETWLCRRAAPIVAAHIAAIRRPAPLGRIVDLFAIGDYGALAVRRHRWFTIAYSALLGGVTHLVWDGLAHRPGAPGWANDLLPFLRHRWIEAWPWWRYGEAVCSIVGGIAALLMFARIGRRRLLLSWDGPAPAVALRPWLFWSVLGACVAADAVTWPLQDYRTTPAVQGVRVLWAISVGALLASAAVASSRGGRSQSAVDHGVGALDVDHGPNLMIDEGVDTG